MGKMGFINKVKEGSDQEIADFLEEGSLKQRETLLWE